jgi:hypothetical protein
LLQGESLKCNGVPFCLESRKKRRDGSECGRSGRYNSRGFELNEIFDGEVLASDRIGVMFGDVGLDQTSFKYVTTLA